MTGAVVVTGAAGFVGRHLVEALAGEGVDVVGWHRARPDRVLPMSPRVRWMEVDVLDRGGVLAAVERVAPTAVYHLAGFANLARSWSETRAAFEGNVLATHYLFDALRLRKISPRVLVTSSSAVYRPQSRALTEDDALEPVSPYAASKLAQEMVAGAAFAEDGLPALVVRAFNHAGPGQSLGYVVPDIARQIALIEAGRKDPVLSMGNLSAERDICDVRDVVRAYVALMRDAKPGVPYNVCAGRAVSVQWLVETLVSQARVPVRLVQDPSKFRPNDVPLALGSHERLTRDTGWEPAIPLERTLADTLDFWRAAVASESAEAQHQHLS